MEVTCQRWWAQLSSSRGVWVPVLSQAPCLACTEVGDLTPALTSFLRVATLEPADW